MSHEFDVLEARVRRLERRERRWRSTVAALGIALISVVLSGGASPLQEPGSLEPAEHESLRVRRLAIVDGTGKERVVLSTVREREGRIEVLSANGRALVEIEEDGIGGDPAGRLALFAARQPLVEWPSPHPESNPLVWLGAAAPSEHSSGRRTGGAVSVANHEGRPVVDLMVFSDGSGRVGLSDGKDTTRFLNAERE